MEAALADMQSAAEGGSEEGESMEEGDSWVFPTGWTPDTGELAEGYSTPHLSDE